MVMDPDTDFCPYRPLPAGIELMSISMLTLVPGFHSSRGRQWASVEDSQFQEPSVAGVAVTLMCFWNEARSVTGTSKRTTTGIATPTVPPEAIVAKTCCLSDRAWVVNVAVRLVETPAVLWPCMAI